MFFPSVYAAIFSTGSSGSINLLPLPAEYMTGNTAACLQEWFEVKWDQDEKHVPEDLRAAAARMMERINKSQHTYLSPTGGAEFFPTGRCENWMDSIKLSFDGSAMLENGTYPSIFDNAIKPVEERVTAESYKLVMHTHGTVMATAYTALGLFRALTSFENMLYTIEQTVPPLVAEGDPMTKPWGDNAEKAKVFYFPYTPYVITDKPAFPWRAVLLDTSRHFYSTRAIKGMLDTMASVKLNVFHWHIVDAQSWPLVLHGLEELAEKGAYSPRKTYSGADVRDIVRYAGERGIDVVIEIDTPGHTKSIAGAFPEYVACGTTSHWGGYANEPPAGQLRFADPEVTSFTSKIFAATAKLTRSPYFSTGGDELNEKCMLEDGPTLEALAANDWTLNDALRVFTNKTHATLRERGITPTVWQEMVLAHGDLELPKDTIVDVWIMASNVRAVLDKGYRVVHASADYFYLVSGTELEEKLTPDPRTAVKAAGSR